MAGTELREGPRCSCGAAPEEACFRGSHGTADLKPGRFLEALDVQNKEGESEALGAAGSSKEGTGRGEGWSPQCAMPQAIPKHSAGNQQLHTRV